MDIMRLTNPLKSSTLVFITACVFSSTSYAHNDAKVGEANHQDEDIFLAAQARKKEAEISIFESWLDQVNAKLTTFSSNTLTSFIKSAFATVNNPAIDGEWGAVTTWPFAFASAANLPDGRVLAWGGNELRDFSGGTFTYAATWDPQTNQMVNVNHPTHSLFCGIPVMLEDGRVFVAGGDKSWGSTSSYMTSTFNYTTQSWTKIQNMHVGRWYNGAVALPNGKVFTGVGAPGSQYPELWTQATGWSYLNGASLQTSILNFPTITEPNNWLPHFHLAPNGQLLHSGHTPEMHYIDTAGNGNVQPVSINNDWNTANTPSVLFDEGKILQVGGALYDANNTASTKAAIIDVNSNIPSRTPTNNMNFPRIFHNQVVLPNGEVMVIGGNTTGVKFNDTGTQNTPEIWNPVTQAWRTVADHQVARNYHSVALLMTDGRVWSGGGGLCNCAADHPDSQVYSPAYLFNSDGSLATRPEIIDVPNLISFGRTVNVTATPDTSKFTMVRMSSTTHALNSDMRFLNVPFITTSNNGDYALTFHTNRNVMTPGYWMLFALNAQGVPSLAKVIKVSTAGAPIIQNPGSQSTVNGTNVNFNIVATDPNGNSLTYNAVGLPQGLTVNNTTGNISGIPTSLGSSLVVISATDGTNTSTANFVWQIVAQQTPVLSGVYGGVGGTSFTDTTLANETLTEINIFDSTSIDAIQGVLNTGVLPKHGGNGGTLTNITWPADEYLVRIYGSYGASIGQISFVTNTGREFGPYGSTTGGNNTTNFDYSVPSGKEIIGFTGRASTLLDAIGVVYRTHIIPNQPPLITTVSDQITNLGDTVFLNIHATDPDGDDLNYSAIGLPPGITIDPDSGKLSGTPTTNGSYDVIVKVEDSRKAASELNFIWSVITPPVQINPLTTTPSPINSVVNLTASVSNATNPEFKWSFGDGSPETTYSTDATTTHTYTSPGLYVVRITVKDSNGLTNTETFVQAIHLPLTTNRPTVSSNMAVSSNNRLWVVNQDNNSVSVFNTNTNAKLAEITVGTSPRTIALAPNGQAWVTNKVSATISVIDPITLKLKSTIKLPYASQPYGLAFAPNGNAAYVVLEATGKLLKLNPSTGAQLASLDIGSNPRHISVQSGSNKLLISRFISKPLPGEDTATVQTLVNNVNVGGEVLVVNAGTMTIDDTIVLQHSNIQDSEVSGLGLPNYLAMPVISPDGQSAWVPSKKDNIKRGKLRNGNNLNFQNTVRSIASKIDLVGQNEHYNSRIDFDNAGVASAAAFDLTGNYLFVALEATREIAIVDAYDGIELNRISVGRAPDGLALSANGQKLYVNNFMDRTVSVIDLSALLSRGDWIPPVEVQFTSITTEKLAANALRGKQLFYDAKDHRLAHDGYLSCAACHNDGGHDGRVWDLTGFGEGLRNTIDLRGRTGMMHGLLHRTANFDEVQDFEGQIRSLADGTGLMTDADFAATQNPMGAVKKAGKSVDLDNLAAYVASLKTFTLSPYRNSDGTLTADAIAGKILFKNVGCVKCHGGTLFTDSPSRLLHDVGTIKPSTGKRLNGTITGLDVQTLRDVWNTAPYMHDGSAPTLDSAILAHSDVVLSGTEVSQLVAYVQQIGSSEPAIPNAAPSIAISAPTTGSAFTKGTSINITTNNNDNDGFVTKVQFFSGTTLLNTDSTAPYSFAWKPTVAGTYSITAKAYDNYGAISTSSAVSITVN